METGENRERGERKNRERGEWKKKENGRKRKRSGRRMRAESEERAGEVERIIGGERSRGAERRENGK